MHREELRDMTDDQLMEMVSDKNLRQALSLIHI